VLADFAAGRERFERYYNPRLFAFSWNVYDPTCAQRRHGRRG